VPLFRKAREALSGRLSLSFLIDHRYIRIYIITISLYQSVADANGMSLTFAKLILIVIIIVAWSSMLLPMYLDNTNLITSVAAQQNSEEDDLFFRGNNVYQQDRYEEAIEYFDRVLAIDPDHWDALNNNHMNALIHKGLALDRLER
jgi:tetratricopeptide (TPR) repeat protein